MALTKLTTDLNIIQTLDTLPNDVQGLSAPLLKAKFDEGPNAIKTFINDVLTVGIDTAIANILGVGGTTETIKGIYDALALHKLTATTDHDGRYYTETEMDAVIDALDSVDLASALTMVNHKVGNDHDSRYYTETEINAMVTTLNGVDATNAGNLVAHKTSSDHLAIKIPYDSTGNTKITGATVQAALTNAENELKSIIGVNANAEVGSARVSTVKAKTFVDLDGRLEESEQDLVSYKAETTTFTTPEHFFIVGESNYTLAMQKAIDYCTNLCGGTVQLKDKAYPVSNVVMKSFVKLIGTSRNSTYITQVIGSTGDVLKVPPTTVNYEISDINIIGLGDVASSNGINIEPATTFGSVAGGFEFGKLTDPTNINNDDDKLKRGIIERIFISKCGGTGLIAEGALIFTSKISISYCGINLNWKAIDSVIDDVEVSFAKTTGCIFGGGNNKISNIKAWYNSTVIPDNDYGWNYCGIYIDNGLRNTFVNIEAQDNYGHGITIYRGGQHHFANVISDRNSVKSRNFYGYYLEATKDNIFSNCSVAAYVEAYANHLAAIRVGTNCCRNNVEDIKIDITSSISTGTIPTDNSSSNKDDYFYSTSTATRTVHGISFVAGDNAIVGGELYPDATCIAPVSIFPEDSLSLIIDFKTYDLTTKTLLYYKLFKLGNGNTATNDLFSEVTLSENKITYVLPFSASAYRQFNHIFKDNTGYRFTVSSRKYGSLVTTHVCLYSETDKLITESLETYTYVNNVNYVFPALYLNHDNAAPLDIGIKKMIVTEKELTNIDRKYGESVSKYKNGSLAYFDFAYYKIKKPMSHKRGLPVANESLRGKIIIVEMATDTTPYDDIIICVKTTTGYAWKSMIPV